MKKRIAAIAMAGAVAVGGSVAGVAVLGGSAHAQIPPRCQKFINQDHLLDALGAEDPSSPLHPALVAVENNIHNCFQKAFGNGP